MTSILWLTENYPPDRGGMSQSCDRIIGHLATLGVAIDVVHFSRRVTEWQIEQGTGGRRFRCPIDEEPAHAMNRVWSVLEREFAGHPPACVVAFGGNLPLLAGPVFAAWLGVPLVTLLRGNDFDSAIFSSTRRDVLRDAVERSARICTVTREHSAKLQALFPDARVELIPNGIDTKSWQLAPIDRKRGADWRAATIPSGRRVLGLFGQLKKKKGGGFFLEALLNSGEAGRFHLLIVGESEPPIEQLLAAHADELSYSQVSFVDRWELLPYYAACDLLVIPSFYDGFPNVLLEGAALGVPLLASNTGGMADLLTDRTNAILFAAGDSSDCSRAMHRAANIAGEELRELGARARDIVLEQFDASREAYAYCRVVESVSAQPRRLLHLSEGTT